MLILVKCWPATYNTTVILHVENKTPQCISIATLSPFQTVRSCYGSPEAAASPFSFKWFTCGKSRPFCRKTPTSAKLNRNVIGTVAVRLTARFIDCGQRTAVVMKVSRYCFRPFHTPLVIDRKHFIQCVATVYE